MMRWLSGQTKKDSLTSSRGNVSPLAWVGLLAVAIGMGLFAVFGLLGMKLLTELVNMLDGVPETYVHWPPHSKQSLVPDILGPSTSFHTVCRVTVSTQSVVSPFPHSLSCHHFHTVCGSVQSPPNKGIFSFV